MPFEPFPLKPDSLFHRYPHDFAQHALDTMLGTVAPDEIGDAEAQALCCRAAIDGFEALRPADPAQAMLAQDVVAAHHMALRLDRKLAEYMDGSAEQSRISGTISRLKRDKINALIALRRIQREDAAAEGKAAEAGKPMAVEIPAGAPTPVPAAAPALDDAPGPTADGVSAAAAELIGRKVAAPPPEPRVSVRLPDSFWRPDGTRCDRPPQMWIDTHLRPDGSVPDWDETAIQAMTMAERRATWRYRPSEIAADEEALRLFPDGYRDEEWAGRPCPFGQPPPGGSDTG